MIIHVVKEGETIDSISNYYLVNKDFIIQNNALSNADNLLIGQSLLILIPKTIHVVKEGESLFSISKIYDISIFSLLRNNPPLTLDSVIYPNEELVIFYEATGERRLFVNGYAYTHVNTQILSKTLPFLSSLTIFGYGIDSNCQLIPINDTPLINLALYYDTIPIMLLSTINESGGFNSQNTISLLKDVNNQNLLIEEILKIMRDKHYYGLDIDFEYIKATDKETYISFIKNTTTKLNAEGFFVNVDLAPKISSEQAGLLYQAHDYKQIGEASNTVLLMTYEWGYTYGPPMPVAPINEVRKVVEYALTEIPKEKIIMGIPNYGYDWALPFKEGDKATSIGNEQAIRIAREYNSTILYDEIAQAPYFYYTKDLVEHVVHFEDARSIYAKVFPNK